MARIYAFPTGDPLTDFENYDAAKEAALARRPVCGCCGHHIQDEYGYQIAGAWCCPKCMDDNFKTYIED